MKLSVDKRKETVLERSSFFSTKIEARLLCRTCREVGWEFDNNGKVVVEGYTDLTIPLHFFAVRSIEHYGKEIEREEIDLGADGYRAEKVWDLPWEDLLAMDFTPRETPSDREKPSREFARPWELTDEDY